MKRLALAIWLCLSAVPAFAQTTPTAVPVPSPCATAVCRAPLPLIGLGLPAAFAVGGVLLGAKLLKRSRRS
jgi:hypothetical protein